MNILSHCVTDRRSMTAAIKHCQKHNIPKLIVHIEVFRKWWFEVAIDYAWAYAWPDAPFYQWVHDHNRWVDPTQKHRWLEIDIWPASMNPEGF